MKVFINHASADVKLARKVAGALQEAGMEVWYDWQILPGDNWAAEVGKALEEADAMVVVCTPISLNSDHIRHALSFALGKEAYRGRVIPVLAAPLESMPGIPWILKKFQIIDLIPDEKEGIQKITEALQNADLAASSEV